jgi:hypothetical protein
MATLLPHLRGRTDRLASSARNCTTNEGLKANSMALATARGVH